MQYLLAKKVYSLKLSLQIYLAFSKLIIYLYQLGEYPVHAIQSRLPIYIKMLIRFTINLIIINFRKSGPLQLNIIRTYRFKGSFGGVAS